MAFDPIIAFRSFIRAGSFFLTLIFLSSTISAAEVTRSLSLEDRVRILEEQLTASNRLRAESQFEITNLKKENRELRGKVEEQGYQLQQIVNRQRELYRDIDNRMSQVTNPDTGSSNPGTSDLSTSNPNYNSTKVDPATTNTESVSLAEISDDVQIRNAYDQIFPLVRNKRYDEAIAGYQQFIAMYPNSIYVANAKYWLAQIYSVQSRTEEAEREYLSVAQQYSSSSKAADAWLKLGQLYENQNKPEKALNAYNQVVTQYADSTAAQMAVNRLQALKSSN